jgi:Predicted glycosyltransferases
VQVSFIIPVFNQLAYTEACLASLKATLPPHLTCEIILIDDGSTDATRDFLRELPPPHVVLFNERNLGYAASNNRAARIAQGKFLALLNNDLVLEPNWLEPLLTAFERFPRAGIVGNIQLAADTGEVDHAGMIFRDGGYPVHHREPLEQLRTRGDYVEFPLVTAACCLVRRDWFLRSGGFDESYKNGFEDNDLCLRAREDGFVNLVATQSVVRHHISRSPGRSTFEFRNAERFLARWGERTAALEREWHLAEAHRHAAARARRYFAPLHRRIGFGATTLRRQHRAALAAEQRARANTTRPVRIGIDLLRMSPGGANGGIKPFLYTLLAEIARQQGPAFNFAVLAQPALRAELTAFLRPGDFVLESENSSDSPSSFTVSRLSDKNLWRDLGRFAADDTLPRRAQLDVLYAPFGTSRFMHPDLPCISFVVDLLHRELPAALPPEEVNARHDAFLRIARDATFIQCNSRHVIERLTHHYGVHPSRCFHIYNVVQDRLPAPSPNSTPPPAAPAGPFFFYPANFWPHKNHETLFTAYRLYTHGAGGRAWPLVLTGQPDARQKLLEEMRDALGLRDQIHFLGHVDDSAFTALWTRAGALVFPSLNEGFGIPLLEAMRFGIPIIAANTTSLPEVAGDAALFIDPRDPRILADALRRVAIRETFREDLVSKSRHRLNAFSLPHEAARLAHFLSAAARHQVP